MKYFIPIDKKTKYIPSHILDIFLKNQGDFKLFPEKKEARYTHPNGDIETLLIVNNFLEFPDYEMIDNFPDVKKIKPYTKIGYAENRWIYEDDIVLAKEFQKENLVDYDNSIEVNSFYLFGNAMWLPKELRISLSNTAYSKERMRVKRMPVNLQNNTLILDVEELLDILSEIEDYANLCYVNTEKHRMAIEELEHIEQIENYDFKTDYPEKLYFTPVVYESLIDN